MKRKFFLGSLFLLSVLWVGAVIVIGSYSFWGWSQLAVAGYAIFIAVVSLIRFCRHDNEQRILPLYGVSKKEAAGIMNIAMSQAFLLLIGFLPRPWTISNYIFVAIIGGYWLLLFRAKVWDQKKKPSLSKTNKPLSLVKAK